jgi:hypothetical protein
VNNPVIDTVSDRPENSEVIETERDDNQLEDQILDSDQLISKIVLPPTMKKRGRSKGITQTVIGLPKKMQERINAFHLTKNRLQKLN